VLYFLTDLSVKVFSCSTYNFKMRTFIFLFLLLVASITPTPAYHITRYHTKNCTGVNIHVGEIKLENGYQKLHDNYKSVKVEWTDEADNDLIFTSYTSDKCCITSLMSILQWQDEWAPSYGPSGNRGYRIISPEDI
jgi:hypothetical protein